MHEICEKCTTRFLVGLARCPHCGHVNSDSSQLRTMRKSGAAMPQMAPRPRKAPGRPRKAKGDS